MERCLKCQGSMRFDRDFPGIICLRCGIVYYTDPNPEFAKMETGSRRRATHPEAA